MVEEGLASARFRLSALSLGVVVGALTLLTTLDRVVQGQQSIAITGDRLSGFVLPIEPIAADVRLDALRAAAWTVDDTKRLLLEGDVKVSLGGYSFSADDAAVWINRVPSAAGMINQVAIYFDAVRDPTKRAGLGVDGGQLLITASTRGEINLQVALLEEQEPSESGLLRRGEERLEEYLKRLLAQPPALENRPQIEIPVREEQQPFIPTPGGTVKQEDLELPSRVELPPTQEQRPWLASPEGIVRFSAEKVEIDTGETENVITIIGSIVIEYLAEKRAEELAQLTLTAERAVIFTDPGPLDRLASAQLEAGNVRGVYLEGNVNASAQEGEYIIRAPHVYYDFRTQQAIMLNSLLRIQPRGTRVPVYARAEELRQLARNQWEAQKVQVSTSEFYTPHLSIGAEQMTVTEVPVAGAPGETDVFLDSRGNAVHYSGAPIIPWPRFRGNIEDVPLRSVEIGSRRNEGFRLLTTWDLFSLLGKKEPDGVEADLKLDGYVDRGAGTGLEFRYDVGDSLGVIDLYGLYDEGEDRTSSGRDVEPDSEFRGIALLENQTQLSRYWSMQAQLSLISDDTFVTSWREDDFLERREYETSLYFKHQKDNAAFTALAKGTLQEFLSNDYLLASRQFAVDKLPEFTYRRYGDSLFGDFLTYSSETRATRMRMVFERRTPREIGVRGRAFGIDDDDEISDSLRAAGLRSNFVSRFDTRHELSLPTKWGPIGITPFVVGRFTGYDDDFEHFSSDSDAMRFFGAAGVRLSTQLQRVHNDIENRLFDLHRLRHLVEPYVTLWSGYSSVNQDDLPEFETEVESLADGHAIQIGLRQVWQTQRGGPERWRSVDVLTLDTSIVFDSEGEPDESPTPQFFEYRPEYSLFGDHVRAQMTWLLSDSLSLVGETTYTLQDNLWARNSIGAELRHSPLLTTHVEYRSIEASDNELLGLGWAYQIAPKYRLWVSPQYDFRADDFRSFNFRITRSFPDFDFTLQVKYDQIKDETSFGASLGVVEF